MTQLYSEGFAWSETLAYWNMISIGVASSDADAFSFNSLLYHKVHTP